jgi:hypothetical protein
MGCDSDRSVAASDPPPLFELFELPQAARDKRGVAAQTLRVRIWCRFIDEILGRADAWCGNVAA